MDCDNSPWACARGHCYVAPNVAFGLGAAGAGVCQTPTVLTPWICVSRFFSMVVMGLLLFVSRVAALRSGRDRISFWLDLPYQLVR